MQTTLNTLKLAKNYQKYPEYKDSGVEWFGKVPMHWSMGPLRSVLTERKEKNKDLVTDNILSVMKDVGVIRYADKGDVGNKSSDRPENYKIVYPGDVVVNSMNLVIGSVGQSKELGVTSSVYLIYRAKHDQVLTDYYHYLFRSKSWQKTLGRLGKGIMELRESISADLLKVEPVPIPTKEEQSRVVEFLDSKTKMVDEIIAKKKRQVELLKEKRTAVINQAVTKGLNENVELVDSGIEWIGKIPKGWEVKKVKHLIDSIESGVWGDNSAENNYDIKCLRVADFDYDNLSFSNVGTVRNNQDLSPEKILKRGDVLIEKSGGGEKTPVGRAILFDSDDRMVCANFIDIVRVRGEEVCPGFLVAYLYFLYASRVNVKYIKQNTGIQNINAKQYFQEIISLPNIKEQGQIVSFIDMKISQYKEAHTKLKLSIELLKELKSSLISNVVTGKIKV